MNTRTTSKLIALTGGSGAGKTWLADRLCHEFGACATRLSLDDFYRDLSHLKLSEREQINFDRPDAIDWTLFEHVLCELRKGITVRVPRYEFASHTRLRDRGSRSPSDFIFVEGLWLLWAAHVRELFDLRFFLDCREPLRWKRRLVRDFNERGRTLSSIHEQFWKVVAPMHERFVEGQKRWADLVIEQPISQNAFGRLVTTIRALHIEQAPVPRADGCLRATVPQVSAFQSL